MAHKIKLTVGGKEHRIVDCQYSIFQPTDQTGKPAGATRAGAIRVTKESSEDGTFFEWAVSNSEKKDGTIVFSKPNMDETMRTIEFKKGFITQYEESCNSESGMQMLESFTISAKEITSSGATVDNEWPD